MTDEPSNASDILRLDIVEVRELTSGDGGRHLNGLLKVGRLLLDTYVSERYSAHEHLVYCLGWPRAKGKVQGSTPDPESEALLRDSGWENGPETL